MRMTWIVAAGLAGALLPATTAHTAPAPAPGDVSAPIVDVVPSAASPWAAHARQLVLDEQARAAPPPPPATEPTPQPAPQPEHSSTWWRPSKVDTPPPLVSDGRTNPTSTCEQWGTGDPPPFLPAYTALQLFGPARGTTYVLQMETFVGGWFSWGFAPTEDCDGPPAGAKDPAETSQQLVHNAKAISIGKGEGVIVGTGPLPVTGPWTYYFLGARWDPRSSPPPIPDLSSAPTGAIYAFPQGNVYAYGASCRGCSLPGLEITSSDAPTFDPVKQPVAYRYVHDLDQADLSGAHLTGQFVDWPGDPPQPWRFDGAILDRATLNGTFSGSTTFAHAELYGIQAPGVTFQGSVNLSTARLTNHANLEGATFDGVDQQHPIDLQEADLTGANLTGARFNNADLTFADLTGAHLEGATFTSAKLNGAILTGAYLDGATFTNSNLTGAQLNGARLSGTSFSNANLTSAVLTGATVAASQAYPSATRFEAGTQLAGATFGNVDLSGVSFDHADLRGFTLAGSVGSPPASFTDVRVGPARGVCTTFPDQNLFALTLTIATADTGCEATPMFPGSLLRLEQIPTNLWSSVSMGGAYLYVDASNRSTLSGANLANADLDGMVLVGVPADLTKTVFDNASLQQAHLELADFAGASLQNTKAHQASFHGARFVGHDGLQPATFQGAILTDTNFVAADISEANFVGADLSDAAFNSVRARGTNFNGVTATNAVFNSAHIYGNGEAFDQATDLTGIDFSNAVLAASADDASGGLNFTNATLVNAKFDGAQCIFCNFTSAKLNEASFSRAYLVGAILTNAVLQSADFDDAWLYCGDLLNSACTPVQGPTQLWNWPLKFDAGEAYGPVAFADTDINGASFDTAKVCPDSLPADSEVGCNGHMLPNPESAPQVPPSGCSASALDVCPLRVSTLAGGEDEAKPVAATPAAPPAWATSLSDDGSVLYLTDDGALYSVLPGEPPVVVEPGGTFHAPSGIAVGVDGSIWVADGGLVRIGPDRKTHDPIDIGANVTANDVWVDPLGQAWIATPTGVIMRAADGSLHPLPLGNFPNIHITRITGDSLGNLWVTTHAPDHLVRIAPDGSATSVVGTEQPGYNGNQDQYGQFLPGNEVQVNQPGGLAVGLDGIVYFADTANNLLRGYRPDNDHVIEVGGLIGDNGPVGGFNGDNCWSTQTEFRQPQDIAVTLFGTFVVADSANNRLRQFGYPPADADRLATSDCGSQP